MHKLLRLTSSARLWLALVCCALVVAVLYFYLDVRIAIACERLLQFFQLTTNAHEFVTESLLFMLAVHADDFLFYAALVILGIGFLVIPRARFLTLYRGLMVFCVSVILAEVFKDHLKMFFGRTIPKSWYAHAPSLLDTGKYGFNFFSGSANTAFPSGHMSVFVAALTVLAIYFPRWRWCWLSMGLFLAIGMLILNFHFLGDIVAGAFLGLIIALGVHRLVDHTSDNIN